MTTVDVLNSIAKDSSTTLDFVNNIMKEAKVQNTYEPATALIFCDTCNVPSGAVYMGKIFWEGDLEALKKATEQVFILGSYKGAWGENLRYLADICSKKLVRGELDWVENGAYYVTSDDLIFRA